MDGHHPLIRLSHFLHRYFLWFLIGSYALAGFWPAFGLWIRGVSFGEFVLFQQSTPVTLPMLMLGLLLMNAGLGVRANQLTKMLRAPWLLLTGLTANLAIPIAYIYVVTQAMRLWHNPIEVQEILVGLALIASMPIAGSSTA
jgi:BASS family bile acid:Na+ symporter